MLRGLIEGWLEWDDTVVPAKFIDGIGSVDVTPGPMCGMQMGFVGWKMTIALIKTSAL
jgi:hypothetical protein